MFINIENNCISILEVSVVQDIIVLVVEVGSLQEFNCDFLVLLLFGIGLSINGFIYNWDGFGLFSGMNGFLFEVNQLGMYMFIVINDFNGCVVMDVVVIIQDIIILIIVISDLQVLNCDLIVQ